MKYYLVLQRKKIAALVEAGGAKEDEANGNMEISKDEFVILKACDGSIAKGRKMLADLQARINTVSQGE